MECHLCCSKLFNNQNCTQITGIVHTVKIVHCQNCTHPLSKLFTPHPQYGIWKMILKFFGHCFTMVKFVYSFGVYRYHRKHVFSFGMGIVSTFLGTVSTAEILLLKKCKIIFFCKFKYTNQLQNIFSFI